MIDALGTIGAGMLLVGYFMVTTRRWVAFSWSYQLTNITASLLLVAYSFAKSAHVNVILNSVFVFIGLYGMYQLVMLGKHAQRK